MNEAMETRGLGAGSYPSAPDLPDYEGWKCFDCGWSDGLKEVDGRLLCRDCREAYYLENCRDRYLDFIHRDREQQQDFFLAWWFENLPEREKAEIAVRAWKEKYRLKNPALQSEADRIIQDYVQSEGDAFREFIESRRGAA